MGKSLGVDMGAFELTLKSLHRAFEDNLFSGARFITIETLISCPVFDHGPLKECNWRGQGVILVLWP